MIKPINTKCTPPSIGEASFPQCTQIFGFIGVQKWRRKLGWVVGKLVTPTNNGNEGKSQILYHIPHNIAPKKFLFRTPYLHKFAYTFLSQGTHISTILPTFSFLGVPKSPQICLFFPSFRVPISPQYSQYSSFFREGGVEIFPFTLLFSLN